MGFLAGIGKAAGILFPGAALLTQLVLRAWLFLAGLVIHTEIEKLSPGSGCPYCVYPHLSSSCVITNWGMSVSDSGDNQGGLRPPKNSAGKGPLDPSHLSSGFIS